jgi:predicted SAM-dependent methyltransferase
MSGTNSRNKLDLGCGNSKPDGWTGLDLVDTEDADVQHDLRDTPLPFEDDRFQQVRAQHVLEHLPRDVMDAVIREMHRITEPGGQITITGPHYLSRNTPAADHYRGFSQNTFNVYTVQHPYPKPEPDLFQLEEIRYGKTEQADTDRLITVLDRWKGTEWVRRHIPNVYDEITFQLRVIRRDD